jgi:GNAT superfamily N-acetyltransferase
MKEFDMNEGLSGPTQGLPSQADFIIREAFEWEFKELGQLMVAVYSSLAGFPSPEQQPTYYQMLTNIGQITGKPGTKLLVAVAGNQVIGGVVFFSDMAHYGSGGTATQESGASGFRLLAVAPEARGLGVGKALALECVGLAKALGRGQVIIHSTSAMKLAWGMYERMGFKRSPDLDFTQGELQVFGFRLAVREPGQG